MASTEELAELRQCMVPQCGLTDVDHILRALNNHILGVHPVDIKKTNLAKIKSAVVKKRSIFLYRKYFMS